MKTLSHHIAHVRRQPHHVRKRVAFSVAGVVTSLIGLVWLVGNLSFGTFMIAGSSFADAEQGGVTTDTTDTSGNSLLAGAAAAAPATVDTSVPRIQIIDTGSSITSQKKVDPTIIPF